jgi:hypothetical protein
MADANWREQLNNALQTSQPSTNQNAPEGLPPIDRSQKECSK